MDDDALALRAIPVNDGEEHFVPPIRTVDIARPELGREAIAARVEDEERVIADGLEVAVVGGLLLRPADRTLGAVDIECPRQFRDRVEARWINAVLSRTSPS